MKCKDANAILILCVLSASVLSKMDTEDTTYEVSPKSALLTGQYEVKQNQPDRIKLSRSRTVLLLLVCGTAYIVWGALISLQPPFYPTEAELKGATPSQVYEKSYRGEESCLNLNFLTVWICVWYHKSGRSCVSPFVWCIRRQTWSKICLQFWSVCSSSLCHQLRVPHLR